MKVFDCKQGTSEWLRLRLGVPTASEIDALVSPEGAIRRGQGPQTFLYKKLCEKLLGYPIGGSGSFATEQGTILESEARPWYCFSNEIDVQTPGFCTTDDGRVGCSPDGLIGTDGGLEIKCFQPEHSLRCLLENEVPKEYVIQIQTSLWVTQRKWWDFLSYSRQWPPLVIRVLPEPKIQAALSEALDAFNERFDALLARITAMRDADNAIKAEAYAKADNGR